MEGYVEIASDELIRNRAGHSPVMAGLARLAVLLVLAVVFGCGSIPETTRSGTVRDIEIRDRVSPRALVASLGDEIRWRNLGGKSVRIGLLGNGAYDHVSCQNGFERFGLMQEFVTIEPGRSVSLCFSHAGLVRYNVWLDADDLRGSMSPTATIKIEQPS